jgi:uncharacterized phosphatase
VIDTDGERCSRDGFTNERAHVTGDDTTTQAATTICLVRHGETDWNLHHQYQGRADVPLNATGREQARLVADAIGGQGWDAIASSPLSRSMETARAIAAVAGIDKDDIEQEPDLVERAYGEAEGLTLAEREERFPEGNWPGLEDWDDVAKRSMLALERIAKRHEGERVLVVCHGGVINAILTVITKGEMGTGITVIINTARTVLVKRGDAWELESVNVVDHLERVDLVPAG